MDGEQFTTRTTTSTQQRSRRRFVLGLMGLVLTAAFGVGEAEARPHHKKKRRKKRHHKRKNKPP
jgi:hypothetical protein